MQKKTDTYTLAYECCDTVLWEDGRFPTIDAIRERIGVNSPTVISRAIKDWTLSFVNKHKAMFERPDMPAVMLDAATSLWQLALQEADKRFDEQRQQFEQVTAADRALIAELQKQLEARQAQWDAERAQLSGDNEALRQANTDLAASLAAAEQTVSQLRTDWVATREALSRAEGSLSAATAANHAQETAWRERFDQQHAWHLTRIEEEKDAARHEHAKIIAGLERSLEELRLEKATAQARITQLMQQIQERHEHQLKWEADLDHLREQLSVREAALQAEKDKCLRLQALVRKRHRPGTTADKASG